MGEKSKKKKRVAFSKVTGNKNKSGERWNEFGWNRSEGMLEGIFWRLICDRLEWKSETNVTKYYCPRGEQNHEKEVLQVILLKTKKGCRDKRHHLRTVNT